MSQNVKFLYLRDPRTPRVVCIARTLSEDRTQLTFSYCVNRQRSAKGVDAFVKPMARKITLARLEQGKSYTIELHEDQRPIEAIMEYLAYDARETNIPRVVQDVAYLVYMNPPSVVNFEHVPVYEEVNPI